MQAPCGSLGGCSRGQGQVCVWEVRSHCHVDPGLEGSRAGLGGGLHQAGSQGEALEVGAGLHSTKSSARHPSPTPALGPRPYPHCSPGSHTLGIRAGGGGRRGQGPRVEEGGSRSSVWGVDHGRRNEHQAGRRGGWCPGCRWGWGCRMETPGSQGRRGGGGGGAHVGKSAPEPVPSSRAPPDPPCGPQACFRTALRGAG